MWPDWVFTLMLIVAACLFVFLAWELIKDVNARIARWWIRRWIQRDYAYWEARRQARMREVLR